MLYGTQAEQRVGSEKCVYDLAAKENKKTLTARKIRAGIVVPYRKIIKYNVLAEIQLELNVHEVLHSILDNGSEVWHIFQWNMYFYSG